MSSAKHAQNVAPDGATDAVVIPIFSGDKAITPSTEDEVIVQQLNIPDEEEEELEQPEINLYAYEREEGAPSRPAWWIASRPSKQLNGWMYWFYLSLWKIADVLRIYRIKPRNGNPVDLKVRKNKRIRMPYYIGSKRKAIEWYRRYMRAMREPLLATVATVSRKGGVFKTGVSMWLSAIFAMATNNQCAVIDFDSTANKAMLQRGGKHQFYNIDGRTGNFDLNVVIDGILNYQWQPMSTDAQALFPRHDQSGLYMVSPSEPTHTNVAETAQVLRSLMSVFPLRFVDTTPGEKEVNTVSIMQISDILLLIDEDNIEGWNRIKRFREGTKKADGTSFDKGLRDRTHFIVIGQVPMDRYNMRYRYALAHHLDVSPDQLILIPEDTYIREIKTLDFDRPGIHFMFAMWSFAYQIADRIVTENKRHPISAPAFDSESSPTEEDMRSAAAMLIQRCGSATAAARYISKVNKM